MFKIIGIIVIIVGGILVVNGIRAILGNLQMKEKDFHNRFYVGIKGIFGGIVAVLLGMVLYFTY